MEVKVPDIGDFSDVPVINILVAVGDTVAREDPLIELESDKATMEVPSPAAGRIVSIAVKEGDKVAEGSLILTLEAAEILQTLVVAVLYNESDDPRPGFNGPHAGDVDHYMLRLLSPDIQKRDDADPEEGDILDHLALISSNLEAMIDVADRDLAASTAGGRVLARAILGHAFEYADRLFVAYKNLPGSLEDLRALTTYAGARPFRDRPQPPIRRISPDCDAVISQLEIARTAAYVLSHNFLGDGDFQEPSKAPGVRQLVQTTSTALSAAEDLARQTSVSAAEIDLISQPRGWADHMIGLIDSWRLEDAGSFRFANQLVGRCFYSIEQLTERAYQTFTGAAE